MSLNNFSSLIEVATALNITLFAFKYLETFSLTLLKQMFETEKGIEADFIPYENFIIDCEATIDTLEEQDEDKKCSIRKKLESFKEFVYEKQKSYINYIEDNAKKVLTPKFSSVSFFLFLYCLTALFIIGIENEKKGNFIKIFWGINTTFTIIYSLCAWLSPQKWSNPQDISSQKKQSKNKWRDFSSFRHPLICYIIVSIISLSLAFILPDLIADYLKNYVYWVVEIISMLFLFSNFIVATIKVGANNIKFKKSKEIKNRRKDTQESIKKQQLDIIKDLSELTNSHIELDGNIGFE